MAKILVVDDDRIIRQRLKNLLDLDGYEPFMAESGQKGLDIFQKEGPEIALVDIKMPGMDGIELLKEIKEKSKKTEVIIITGHGGIETAIQALKRGAFGYIQKPIEYDELVIEIEKALEKQQMQRKLDGYVFSLEKALQEKDRELNLRRKAEQALRKSEQNFRNLTESLTELVYRADPNTWMATYVNSAVEGIYGYSADQWLKDPDLWERIIHPDDKKRLMAEVAEAQRKAKNGTLEYRIINKDKGVRWLVDHFSWEKDREGKPVSVNGVVYDITDRKKTEEKIKRASEEWRETFDSISDPVFIQDNDFTIVKGNKSFAEFVKISSEDIIGKKCYELVHKSDKPWPKCLLKKTIKDAKSQTQEVDDPNIGIPLLVTISPIFDDKGKVVGSVCVAKDISEIKKIRKELEKKIYDLEKFHKVAVGRELKMVELKKKIVQLEARLEGLGTRDEGRDMSDE